jgi:hypothetical protein
MLDIFLGICRCRISNVLKHPKLFYMWRKLKNQKGERKLISPRKWKSLWRYGKINFKGRWRLNFIEVTWNMLQDLNI